MNDEIRETSKGLLELLRKDQARTLYSDQFLTVFSYEQKEEPEDDRPARKHCRNWKRDGAVGWRCYIKINHWSSKVRLLEFLVSHSDDNKIVNAFNYGKYDGMFIIAIHETFGVTFTFFDSEEWIFGIDESCGRDEKFRAYDGYNRLENYALDIQARLLPVLNGTLTANSK